MVLNQWYVKYKHETGLGVHPISYTKHIANYKNMAENRDRGQNSNKFQAFKGDHKI